MKKLSYLIVLALALASCGENIEKKASMKLQLATEALERNNFAEAKLQIDSIKILYPKAFDARKQGIQLMKQVELREQEQSLLYLDSILNEKQAAFEAIKDRFVLEKDPQYQDVGNYFWPTQTVEKNLHRSFLRFQVDEKGNMLMTSIYCGGSNIHHIAVKVTAPDGTFAETPASNDIYETTDLGEKIEKADYRMRQDGNVIGFIYLNKDKKIRVDYLGERKYNTTMSESDRRAAAEVYDLALILSSIEAIKKGIQEANLKIGFFNPPTP